MKKTTQSGALLIVSGCLALCGWGETILSFSPEGANWAGGEGLFKFEDTANWTRVSSGTADELSVIDTRVSLYLGDDVSLTKLKLRSGKEEKPIDVDLRGHSLSVTESLTLRDQDVVVSNGTMNVQKFVFGESGQPTVHLTLSNVTCKVKTSSQSIQYKNSSLALYDTDFDYADANQSGFSLSGSNTSFIVHNSAVETNSTKTGALTIDARDVRVLVDGEKSNLNLGYFLFKSEAVNSLFSICDGVSFVGLNNSNNILSFESGSTSNLVTIGKMKTPFYRQYLRFQPGSVGNRLVIGKDGCARFAYIKTANPFSGIANRIEINNGTCTNAQGCVLATDLNADGNAIALKGDDATFVVGQDLVVGNKENTHAPMRFEFTPGETGFNGVAPFRAIGGNSYTKAISNLVVSVDATAFVGEKTGKFKLPLMKFSYAPQRLEVDELNAVLESEPAGGTLSYDTTDKTLYWNYRKPGGLILIFR